jgi:hypothetical protein
MEMFVGYLQIPAKKMQQFTQRRIIGVRLSASTEVADNLILGAKQSRAKITTVMRMRTNARSMGRCGSASAGTGELAGRVYVERCDFRLTPGLSSAPRSSAPRSSASAKPG